MAQDKRRWSLTRPFSRWNANRRGIRVDTRDSLENVAKELDFGMSVNNNTALKNTTYYAGIRIIGENFASLPKSVKRWRGNDLVADSGHRINHLLHHPNEYTNEFVFWNTLAVWVKDWGNAYALIVRDNAGNPVELHQCHPSGVNVALSNKKKRFRLQFSDTDLQHLNGIYPAEDVLHFMEVSLDGLKGVNPVELNASSLEKAAAQEKFAAEFYRKGGNIKAVMETEGNLGDDRYNKFMEHFQHASQNFDTPLLEYGVKYKQLSVNPVAAQLLQSQTFSIHDVCRILGIPPHMVAELSHATFSNIEHQTIQFVEYTLRPLVKRFEVELESKLFFDDERASFSIDFNLQGLLRGDTAARSAYYHNAILDGYLSRNEVRALEGYEKKPELDKFLYPQNESVVGQENNDTE